MGKEFTVMLTKELNNIDGILIIKGSASWARFMRACGFNLRDFSPIYKVGGVQVMYSTNPHLVNNVIALE